MVNNSQISISPLNNPPQRYQNSKFAPKFKIYNLDNQLLKQEPKPHSSNIIIQINACNKVNHNFYYYKFSAIFFCHQNQQKKAEKQLKNKILRQKRGRIGNYY